MIMENVNYWRNLSFKYDYKSVFTTNDKRNPKQNIKTSNVSLIAFETLFCEFYVIEICLYTTRLLIICLIASDNTVCS